MNFDLFMLFKYRFNKLKESFEKDRPSENNRIYKNSRIRISRPFLKEYNKETETSNKDIKKKSRKKNVYVETVNCESAETFISIKQN